MGIVAKQSFYNTLGVILGFLIGGANVLILYPMAMGAEFYGLIAVLLATSNLFQPFFSFGTQHTLIRFFSSYNNKKDKDSMLFFSLIVPLVISTLLIVLIAVFYDRIVAMLAIRNSMIKDFAFAIFWIAIATSYFEIFYSWFRVHLKTTTGNFFKEVFPRVSTTILLGLRIFDFLDNNSFVIALIIAYYIRLFIIVILGFYYYAPPLKWKLPANKKELLRYSFYILLSGSAASILIDIDKVMIGGYEILGEVAFYSIAIYIANFIETPGRALFQILSPLTAKAINDKNFTQLKKLLKNSSNTLLFISGLLFLVILTNINDVFTIIESLNNDSYRKGAYIVLIIGIARLFNMSIGCINHIISNSKYYYYQLYFSVISAIIIIGLNRYFIPIYGINGAAFGTLIILIFLSSLKIILVYTKFKIQPYSLTSLKILVTIMLLFFIARDFTVSENPYWAIAIKGCAIGIFYVGIGYYLKFSKEINQFINQKLRIKS